MPMPSVSYLGFTFMFNGGGIGRIWQIALIVHLAKCVFDQMCSVFDQMCAFNQLAYMRGI